MKNFKKSLILLPLFVFILGCGLANADTLGFELILVAPQQSIFESGVSPYGDGLSDSIGDPSLFGMSINIGINTGTVVGTYKGLFEIDYTDSMTDIGDAHIEMSFAPESGGVVSEFGAWVELSAYLLGLEFPAVDFGPSLTNIESAEPWPIGAALTSSDSDEIIGIGVGIPFLAEANIDLGVEKTDEFAPMSLDSTIRYGLRGSGVSKSFLFSVDHDTTIAELELDQPGIWDFSFDPFNLQNYYKTDFGFYLSPNALVLGNEINLGTIPIGHIDGDPFQLTFQDNEGYRSNVFSILVGDGSTVIPEPTSLLLLGTGLGVLGLAVYRRKRK